MTDMAGVAVEEEASTEYGVLLYYKYTPPIDDLNSLFDFYHSTCSSLSLLGRVRISPHGVNVTVGGKLSALQQHISAVKDNPLFEGTDFKLASCTQPLNDKVAEECGFTSLSIRIVKELVTLSSNPLLKLPTISDAGRHLSAAEFHSVLSAAGKLCEDEGPGDGKKLVLLDARNLYETRIGKFETQSVETLDPGIRQYSDLPSWVDDNVDKLRGNRVLMYCTGGIRCEMASAYIRSKGAGFENVYQLYGGIQRYMEQFPDGGYFKGKNFVFDHRISVGSTSGSIIGKCLLCGLSFDDYSLRCRCAFCRMLVLVCNDCRKESTEYACEICQRHQNVAECGQSLSTKDSKTCTNDLGCDSDDRKAQLLSDQTVHVSCSPGLSPSRKLRILCLHGFRQNASGFKGRTASLAKKLKNIAELVFVNAPYELPFMYQPTRNDDNVPCLPEQDPPPMQRCNKKYAWLVAPGFHSRSQDDWDKTDAPFDPNQYQQQTEGFKESLSYLNSIFCQQGPFDGILGFSQGAAMTALVCAERARLEATMNFRFAILCSGFAVKLSSLEKGSINFPSLHVFGTHLGRDRQIASDSSRDLASVFEEGCRVIIEHDSGHIIPTQTPYIDQIRGFLGRFA